jgi:DNA repair protein RadC
MKKISIKSWALDDRPREKLVTKGKTSLSNAELLAVLIGSGNREESAVELSKRILRSVNGNIHELEKMSVEKLVSFRGIGVAKAVAIITALELGRRREQQLGAKILKIGNSKDVYTLMKPILADKSYEEFWIVYLNNANKVLAKQLSSRGGITATIVDVRLLFKRALELSAVGIIVCHNHPSGNIHPSASDRKLTEKIKQAGKSLDIQLLDHLIIGEKSYFSFADQGEI